MHQKRKETKEYLFEQLKICVPVRSKITSQKRLEHLSEMIDYDPVLEFLETNSFNLKWSELPKGYGFKLICFLVLLTHHIKAYYADDKIFDVSDKMTVKKLEIVKEFFSHEGNISEISLENFYLRIVSRKPNW